MAGLIDENPYRGWKFPFQFSRGRVAVSGGPATREPTVGERDEAAREGVAHIVLTGQGERVMIGQFGGGAYNSLFKPITFAPFLVMRVREQVNHWCRRARVNSAMPMMNPEQGQLRLHMEVRHIEDEADSAMVLAVGGGGDG